MSIFKQIYYMKHMYTQTYLHLSHVNMRETKILDDQVCGFYVSNIACPGLKMIENS